VIYTVHEGWKLKKQKKRSKFGEVLHGRRFWKMNSSNNGKRGCGAGPSKVTLNLSVYKPIKNSLHVFYNTPACDSYLLVSRLILLLNS